jgi:uncharacterized membrane protein YeaQ/YmgE (transglycosylase-associated protein family)
VSSRSEANSAAIPPVAMMPQRNGAIIWRSVPVRSPTHKYTATVRDAVAGAAATSTPSRIPRKEIQISTLGYIILLLFSGLLLGALGRLLLPGRDPMSIFGTVMVGIAGSLIAGLIAYYAFDEREGPGFLLSVVCTVGLVYLVRKVRERQSPPLTGRR